MNGEYYAKGRAVFKHPTRTVNPDGSENISFGFRVCDLADGVSEDGAAEIALALSQHPDKIAKAAAFHDAIAGAKIHGKEWWAHYQLVQIEMHVAQDRTIAKLCALLEQAIPFMGTLATINAEAMIADIRDALAEAMS